MRPLGKCRQQSIIANYVDNARNAVRIFVYFIHGGFVKDGDISGAGLFQPMDDVLPCFFPVQRGQMVADGYPLL